MDYKNLFLRLIFSLVFISIYLLFAIIDFKLIFYLIIIIYLLIVFEIIKFFKIMKAFPIIYLFLSFLFFLNIDFENTQYKKFNLLIVIVVTFDIFSFICGKIFGKYKLSKISPNKTYEGLIGGLIFSLTSGIIYSYFNNFKINITLLIIIFFIIAFSFIGDILESYFKRKNLLKNSSEIIPGHGGVFDRFDSFLFSIIFYSISNNYII